MATMTETTVLGRVLWYELLTTDAKAAATSGNEPLLARARCMNGSFPSVGPMIVPTAWPEREGRRESLFLTGSSNGCS